MVIIPALCNLSRRAMSLGGWALPLSILVGWTAYPALTDAYKHEMMPFLFPNPDAAEDEMK